MTEPTSLPAREPASTDFSALFSPFALGPVSLKNRFVRAATSETMANSAGHATERLFQLYDDLSGGGAALLITGHIYVEPAGQYEPGQVGLYNDAGLAQLRRITDRVHANGAAIFAELSHAGSQTILPHLQPVAPSPVPNAMHARQPAVMTGAAIESLVAAYGAAARRAVEAGFDGIHIHGGNGYLLSQFSSPHTNRRDDAWGGDAQRRGALLFAVYQAIRAAVGPRVAVTARIGIADSSAAGLTMEEGLQRVARLADAGLDAVEPTYNIMASYKENIRPYVGNTLGHALRDGLVHQFFSPAPEEAYYLPFADAIRAMRKLPIILVGGLRTVPTMVRVIENGQADLIAMARPLVRQPDLPNRIAAGETPRAACVSCNLCLVHEGLDPLQCWRVPKTRILAHFPAFYLYKGEGVRKLA
jgi:2,4-dienoyl-CoA reductase-like NADH-dependent reductase (Old Yellow Enzyme family)